jgi:hypothetical protein
MVYFQNKNPNLGQFRKVLHWKMLVYFMAIWSISRGTFYSHLVYFYQFGYIFTSLGIFLPVWVYFYQFGYIFTSLGIFLPVWVYFYQFGYIFTSFGISFTRFGMLYQDISGNPGSQPCRVYFEC